MAIDTYLIGNDGNVSYGFGATITVASSETFFKVRSYAATLQRNVSDLTSFGDTGKRKRLGMLDLTGTLNAVIGVDSTGSTTSTHTSLVLVSAQNTDATRPWVTLMLSDTVHTQATNNATITANAVFSSFAFNSDKSGDTAVTVNFENANGTAPVVTWLL